MWVPWDLAAVGSAGLGIGAVAVRRAPRRIDAGTRRRAADTLRQVALVAALYALWRLGQRVHGITTTGGIERAWTLWRIERWLHLPDERWLVDVSVAHPTFAQAANGYYAVLHAPAMVLALGWVLWRHRPAFPYLRDALAAVTAVCLGLHLVAVAPPRMLPELGFVDIAAVHHQSVYGPVGSGLSDQMGALPSVHVAWAVLVCWATWRLGRGWARWVGPAHLGLTLLAVTATANHWWLDGAVSAVFVWAALWASQRLRRRAAPA